MATSYTPQSAPAFDPDSPLVKALSFAGGSLGGFVLMGVLSLHVWPAVFPHSDFLVTGGAGLAAALFVALTFGLAGLIACAARSASFADPDS